MMLQRYLEGNWGNRRDVHSFLLSLPLSISSSRLLGYNTYLRSHAWPWVWLVYKASRGVLQACPPEILVVPAVISMSKDSSCNQLPVIRPDILIPHALLAISMTLKHLVWRLQDGHSSIFACTFGGLLKTDQWCFAVSPTSVSWK